MDQVTVSMEERRSAGLETWVWAFAFLGPLLALSRESFWIDEAVTGLVARQPTIHDWWQTLWDGHASDVQMPFYMIYIWGWAKVFGTSEIALRLANLPWLVIAQLAGGFIFRDRLRRIFYLVSAALGSFVWLYLNEARPYMMQNAFACLIICFLLSIERETKISQWKLWGLAAAIVGVAGTTMLGALWAASALLATGWVLARKRSWPGTPIVAVTAMSLFSLGLFYVLTLRAGARGTVGHASFLNVLYVPYELLGYTGLGPGRLALREGGFASLRHFIIPICLFSLLLLVILFAALFKKRDRSDRSCLIAVATYGLPPAVILLIAAGFVRFGVLGRHVTPTLPLVFFLCAEGLAVLWLSPKKLSNLIVCVYLALSALSCFAVRFFPNHQKDDYRSAAIELQGLLRGNETGWWCASREGAKYYRLPLDHPESGGPAIIALRNPSPEALAQEATPKAIAVSKADLYDAEGTIAQYIKEKHFQKRATLTAFTIWSAP